MYLNFRNFIRVFIAIACCTSVEVFAKNPTATSKLIYEVSKCRDQATIEQLVNQGADVHHLSASNKSLIHISVEANCLKLLPNLVQKGVDLNIKESENGYTALIMSTKLGRTNNLEMFKFLISNGASIDEQDNKGETALFHVAKYSFENRYWDILIQAGANPNIANLKGNTVLMKSFREKYHFLRKFYKTTRGKLNLQQVNLNGESTAIVYAKSGFPAYSGIFFELLEDGSDPNLIDKNGESLFQHVVKFFNRPVGGCSFAQAKKQKCRRRAKDTLHFLEGLVQRGGDVNLLLAGEPLVFKFLSDYQSPAYKDPIYGTFPRRVLKELIRSGANIESKNLDGDTPLLWLCKKEYLPSNFHVPSKGGDGETIADYAKILLDSGADLEVLDGNGLSCLTHAKKQGNVELVDLLLNY